MDVSENSGTPKSSILREFSIINHLFLVPLFLETPIYQPLLAGFDELNFYHSKKVSAAGLGSRKINGENSQKKKPLCSWPSKRGNCGEKAPFKTGTPWKINMEPENDGLEDDLPFQLDGF